MGLSAANGFDAAKRGSALRCSQTYREIFAFPKRIRCLRAATLEWPTHLDLLQSENAIEDLVLSRSHYMIHMDRNDGFPLWNTLRGIKSLKKLRIENFPTNTPGSSICASDQRSCRV